MQDNPTCLSERLTHTSGNAGDNPAHAASQSTSQQPIASQPANLDTLTVHHPHGASASGSTAAPLLRWQHRCSLQGHAQQLSPNTPPSCWHPQLLLAPLACSTAMLPMHNHSNINRLHKKSHLSHILLFTHMCTQPTWRVGHWDAPLLGCLQVYVSCACCWLRNEFEVWRSRHYGCVHDTGGGYQHARVGHLLRQGQGGIHAAELGPGGQHGLQPACRQERGYAVCAGRAGAAERCVPRHLPTPPFPGRVPAIVAPPNLPHIVGCIVRCVLSGGPHELLVLLGLAAGLRESGCWCADVCVQDQESTPTNWVRVGR